MEKSRIFHIFAEIIYRIEEIPQNLQNFYIYMLNSYTLFLQVQYEKQQ